MAAYKNQSNLPASTHAINSPGDGIPEQNSRRQLTFNRCQLELEITQSISKKNAENEMLISNSVSSSFDDLVLLTNFNGNLTSHDVRLRRNCCAI